MDFKPFFNLFKANEKNLLKSVLISFPCFYLTIYLYFPSFIELDIFSTIMITLGVAVLMTTILYFNVVYLNDCKSSIIYGFITLLLVCATLVAISLGLFLGFNVETLCIYGICVGIFFMCFAIKPLYQRKKQV